MVFYHACPFQLALNQTYESGLRKRDDTGTDYANWMFHGFPKSNGKTELFCGLFPSL